MPLNYQRICSNLLGGLPERTKDILLRRFGLNPPAGGGEKETLEGIGQRYGVTRERVRQIEEDGMERLKRPEVIRMALPVFNYFQDHFKSQGGLEREDILLNDLGQDKFKNQVFFFLTLGDPFFRYGETKELYPFWTTKPDLVQIAQEVINYFISAFQKESEPLPKTEFFETEKRELRGKLGRQINLEFLVSSYEIAKKIEENPFGEIGLTDWPEIIPRGIKDRAYIVFKKEEKPLHFMEITEKINKLGIYPEKALSQTVHNELIKDPRFVLVGRGTYALAEWGYKPGWVKDIISEVLKEAKKPLAREEVIEKVLGQRLVKVNTILLNLSNREYFSRTEDGKYTFKN
jgi:hypothetical protein